MANKIIFNGVEYNSAEEMPEGVRAAYQKALSLAAKGGAAGALPGKVNVKLSTRVRFVYGGKAYESVDQMPPEVRAKYELAMQQIDRNHDGVPDVLQGNTATSAAPEMIAPTSPADALNSSSNDWAPIRPTIPVIAADQPNKRMLMAGVAIIVMVALVVVGLALNLIQH